MEFYKELADFKINHINLIITVATHKPFLFLQQIPPEGSHRIKIRSNNYLSIIKSSFIASDFLKAFIRSIDKKNYQNLRTALLEAGFTPDDYYYDAEGNTDPNSVILLQNGQEVKIYFRL